MLETSDSTLLARNVMRLVTYFWAVIISYYSHRLHTMLYIAHAHLVTYRAQLTYNDSIFHSKGQDYNITFSFQCVHLVCSAVIGFESNRHQLKVLIDLLLIMLIHSCHIPWWHFLNMGFHGGWTFNRISVTWCFFSYVALSTVLNGLHKKYPRVTITGWFYIVNEHFNAYSYKIDYQ